jgi:hypothetical protein
MNLSNLFQWIGRRKPLDYTATKCGHHTEQYGSVSAFGHTITIQMSMNEYGSVDYCFDCISKMTIRCAWCGNPIFISDPVTLYTPYDDFKIPEYAVINNEKPLQLVGCLRRNCADTGADRAGFWLPNPDDKGYVHRVHASYAHILDASDNHS